MGFRVQGLGETARAGEVYDVYLHGFVIGSVGARGVKLDFNIAIAQIAGPGSKDFQGSKLWV